MKPDTSHSASLIVVGLGNPILGDDGIGWQVAEQVARSISENSADDREIIVECLAVGGLSLMEHLVGYGRAILIDAINIGLGPTGSIHSLPLQKLPDFAGGHLTSAHDTSLLTALHLGRSMGAQLPEEIIVVGIETPYVYDFTEELTPPVAAALPLATNKVLELITNNGQNILPKE